MRAVRFGVGVALLILITVRCSEVGVQTPPVEEEERRIALHCQISGAHTMDNAPLALAVPELWIDSRLEMVFRADEYEYGRVVRNPYLLHKENLPPELKAEIDNKGWGQPWDRTFWFRHDDQIKWLLMVTQKNEGRILTTSRTEEKVALAESGGEDLELACVEIESGSVKPHEELVAPELPEGCADGSVEQQFAENMVGCSGRVSWKARATLCTQGWRPCLAKEWVKLSNNTVPQFNYWTDDNLRRSGSSGRCSVSTLYGTSCLPYSEPMRVCSSTLDPLGNRCYWTGCGLDTYNTNHYFGGCSYQDTAGTLCCQ